MIARQVVLDYARTLQGTPFHHQGRLPGVGLDCIGFLVCICRNFAITFHDFQGYSRRPEPGVLLREFDKVLQRIEPRCVQPGDFITFWFEEATRDVQHGALATDKGILHSTLRVRRVVEHPLDDYWQKRTAVCYRLPNIDPSPYPQPFTWRSLPPPPVFIPGPLPRLATDPRVSEEVRRQIAAMGYSCCG